MIRGIKMYDIWVSGMATSTLSAVMAVISMPSGFLVVFENPSRSSFTFTPV
jgi:hypothetical protein